MWLFSLCPSEGLMTVNHNNMDFFVQVRILFVRNLMSGTSESTIRDMFEKLSRGLPPNEPAPNDLTEANVDRVKKTKDYAFVHFKTR
jgi:RNA recognition motif-containing protein